MDKKCDREGICTVDCTVIPPNDYDSWETNAGKAQLLYTMISVIVARTWIVQETLVQLILQTIQDNRTYNNKHHMENAMLYDYNTYT